MGVAALGLDKVIGTLSGGQRAKVMLTKLILENPDVMLLDEPTNFLDVEHIEWLEKYLVSVKKLISLFRMTPTFSTPCATV